MGVAMGFNIKNPKAGLDETISRENKLLANRAEKKEVALFTAKKNQPKPVFQKNWRRRHHQLRSCKHQPETRG